MFAEVDVLLAYLAVSFVLSLPQLIFLVFFKLQNLLSYFMTSDKSVSASLFSLFVLILGGFLLLL